MPILAVYKNLIITNTWDRKTATGHLVWTYEELMHGGLQMFGATISEAQMRMQLRKVTRKPDETLPKLVQRMMAVTKRAVTVPEETRSGAECQTFLEAIADNRPLYFFVNRAKAMNYSNEEGASDEWVNELVHKELEKQGITVKSEKNVCEQDVNG